MARSAFERCSRRSASPRQERRVGVVTQDEAAVRSQAEGESGRVHAVTISLAGRHREPSTGGTIIKLRCRSKVPLR